MKNFRDAIFYPYYARLLPSQRRLYEELLTGYLAYQAHIAVKEPVQFQQVSDVINAIYYDHPEIFWMTSKATITHNTASGVVTEVSPKYLFTVDCIQRIQNRFQATVRKYLSVVAGKKPLEQERILHDSLADKISYVHNAYDQTAYGALVEGRAVCAGYARAFQLLMQEIGIPCYYCQGEGKNAENGTWERHAWNILKLGAEYYNMDLTWDDCFDKQEKRMIAYTYYNCDDKALRLDHRRAETSQFLPACNGTTCSFEGVTGIPPELSLIYQDGVSCRQVIRSVGDFKRLVFPEIYKNKNRNTQISFPVEGTQNYNRLKETITSAVEAGLSDTLYRIDFRYTDFKNSWYKIQMTITYENPLTRIYEDGVTCQNVVRSKYDFERFILPEIRRHAGATFIISFPLSISGDFEAFRQVMSDSIRGLFADRSYKWTGTWKNYCGNWYWMQYKLEYE